jgi:hypothetical protein
LLGREGGRFRLGLDFLGRRRVGFFAPLNGVDVHADERAAIRKNDATHRVFRIGVRILSIRDRVRQSRQT